MRVQGKRRLAVMCPKRERQGKVFVVSLMKVGGNHSFEG